MSYQQQLAHCLRFFYIVHQECGSLKSQKHWIVTIDQRQCSLGVIVPLKANGAKEHVHLGMEALFKVLWEYFVLKHLSIDNPAYDWLRIDQPQNPWCQATASLAIELSVFSSMNLSASLATARGIHLWNYGRNAVHMECVLLYSSGNKMITTTT